MPNQQLIESIEENKSENRFHSLVIIMAMVTMLSVVGYLTFGFFGFVVSIGIALFSCLLGPQVSTAWVMR
ncbi:MAG: hypothetical protein AAGA30_09375, partial [Planctomycetota bacterium]